MKEKIIEIWQKIKLTMQPVLEWHEQLVWDIMMRFGWDEYGMLWLAFFKGIILVVLLILIF